MANAVADALHPTSRSDRWALKLRILFRMTPLIYARRLQRVGRKYLALR